MVLSHFFIRMVAYSFYGDPNMVLAGLVRNTYPGGDTSCLMEGGTIWRDGRD